MQAPLPTRIDLLIEEFKQAIVNSQNSPLPGSNWQQFLTNFLKKMVYECTGADQPFDAEHPDIPHPFVYCLSGPVARGIGSPLSTIDAFVMIKDEQDKNIADQLAERINAAMKKLNAELWMISQRTNENYLRQSVLVDSTKFCGTQEQLKKKMSGIPDSYINAIFTAIPLVGDAQLLTNLQKNLKSSPIHSDNIYADSISFFYGISVVEFDGAVKGDMINLKNDIMRPVLAILDGLRLEFTLDDHLSPKNLIEALSLNKHISQDAARLFTLVLNRIGQLRWHLDMQKNNTQELIPITQENIREIVDIVALLRAEAKTRVKIQDKKVFLNENRPKTFAIDKANAPYLDRIFTRDTQAFDLYVGTDIIPAHLQHELPQIAKNVAKANTAAGIATRIFNNIAHPQHLATYGESFFRCIDDGVLNKDKFNQWMNTVVCRCIHDLFDAEGNLKKSIVDIINKDNMYEKIVNDDGKETVNKNILFSYFMNPLFLNTVLIDQRYKDLSGGIDNVRPSISRATQHYTNEYFDQNIKVPNVLLKDIHNVNYYVSLSTVLLVLDNIIIQFKNALNEKLEEREARLYKQCLGTNADHYSLLGIMHSLRQYLQQHRGKFVSTEVFHDYRDRINFCFNSFLSNDNAKQLKLELNKPKSFPLSLFSSASALNQLLEVVNKAQIDLDAIAAEKIILQPPSIVTIARDAKK